MALTFTSIAASSLNMYKLEAKSNNSSSSESSTTKSATDTYQNTNLNDAVSALSEIAYNQLRGNVDESSQDNTSNIVNLAKALSGNDPERFATISKSISDAYSKLGEEYGSLLSDEVTTSYQKIVSELEIANKEITEAIETEALDKNI